MVETHSVSPQFTIRGRRRKIAGHTVYWLDAQHGIALLLLGAQHDVRSVQTWHNFQMEDVHLRAAFWP